MPLVVPADRLPLATTLDSFAWSLMGAVGASLGGLAVCTTQAAAAPRHLADDSMEPRSRLSEIGMELLLNQLRMPLPC